MGTYIRGAAVVGAFLVLCLSEFVGAPALASDDDPSPDMTAAERVAAYPDETEELANRYDISEARAEAEQIDRIKVDPFIADLDPDVFTGVYFTESKDGPYTLHVVTKNGFAQTLDMPQLDALTVVYESQPYSLTDLLAIRDQVRYEPGVLWTSIKPDTGTVDIIVDSLETAARTSAVSNAIRTTLGEQATPASCNSLRQPTELACMPTPHQTPAQGASWLKRQAAESAGSAPGTVAMVEHRAGKMHSITSSAIPRSTRSTCSSRK